MANNIGSMLCPHCGKLISVKAETCIHCGKRNPRSITTVPLFQKLLSGHVSFVQGITTVCVALYLIALLIDIISGTFSLSRGGIFGLLPPSSHVLDRLGWSGAYPVIIEGRWWTIFSGIYLHGGLLHILFNMLWIRQLGPAVEELFGSSRFFIIFTVSGAVGFLVSTLFKVPATVGASGAIFGLFGAIVYYGRHRGGSFGQAIYRQTAAWAVLLFILGLTWAGVDNYAHAGGFIGGYVTGMLLGYNERKRETFQHRSFAIACLAISGFALLMGLIP